VHAYRRSKGPHNNKLLPCGSDNFGTQLHLALQQLCVKQLHQLLLGLAFLGLEVREVQVEFMFLLFGHVGQGLHNLADHLAHVLGHHYGPFGLLYRRSLGCDNYGRLALHQLVDYKVANGREKRYVLNGCLHLG